MDVVDEWIAEETFAECLSKLPEATVEIALEHDGGVLVAKRTNEPAKGEWFWPGGRLRKGETFEAAVQRIAAEELGVEVELLGQLGAVNHFWDAVPGRAFDSRHTVNVVHHVAPADPGFTVELDDQHSDYRFISGPDPAYHEHVNAYFERFDLLA